MSNNILSYTSRDKESTREDYINAISSLTDIWTSREASDPGMVLTDLMASLNDCLSFNMDKQSLEFFGRTVTQRKNAQYVFDHVGYKMHWYESAQVEIEVFNLSETNSVSLVFNPTGAHTQRLTSSLIASTPPYFILNPLEQPHNWNQNTIISIPPGQSEKFTAVQGNLNSIKFSSASIDSNNRYYLPTAQLDQNHIWLMDEDNAFNWYLTDSINELTQTLPRFEFGVDEYNMPYIEFVPYWRSSFIGDKNTTKTFTLYYLSTLGSAGDVTSNVLNYISGIPSQNENSTRFNPKTDLSIAHGTNAYYTDNLNNIPGKDPETAREAYKNSKLYIGTHNTLVTLPDFEKFFKRIGIISNALAVDGQKAKDLNVYIADKDNKVIFDSVHVDNTDAASDNDGTKFKPFQLVMHLIAQNFAEIDPLSNGASYATSKAKVLDQENTLGYMEYMLGDTIVGMEQDSVVNSVGLEDYKLVTADVLYGPVRKFPFMIDGEIHLKEPVDPIKANHILRKVHNNIGAVFTPDMLKFGQKIKFGDIIDVINASDSSIDYFDAGANNRNGSLFIYPTTENLNPYALDENGNYKNFEVNIDPKYFNPISMQHYEDLMPENNQYIYWSNTVSGCLSIAPDSIKNKITPYIGTLNVSASKTVKHDEQGNVLSREVKVDVYDVSQLMLPIFEYAFVPKITTVGYSFSTVISATEDLVWQDSNIFDVQMNDFTDWRYLTEDSDEDDEAIPVENTRVFAVRMKATNTTEISEPTYVACTSTDDENRD